MNFDTNKPYSIEQIADLLTDIASVLMSSGAHTMRIIQNASRMAEHFGYRMDLSVFPMSIMMTLTNKEDATERLTLIKKTPPTLLNFTFVSELSALSWETYDKELSYEEVKAKFAVIIAKKRLSKWIVLVLVGFANAAFCALFQGDIPSMALVFLATVLGFFTRQQMMKNHAINHLVVFTTSAFVASLTAGMAYMFKIGTTPEIALAASVLYLIPGVPLINSVLDIIEGHILTGMSRLVNAISLIVCIAFGLFSSMLILGLEKL